MEHFVSLALTTLVASLVGSYLGAYLKKKGENLAQREDVRKLVSQVEAITQATKAIEAKISNEVWDRQKQWEIKRDALFEAVRALGGFEDALLALYSSYTAAKNSGEGGADHWLSHKSAAVDLWQPASARFDNAKLLASLVCEKHVSQQLTVVSLLIRETARKIFAGEPQAYLDSALKRAAEVSALMAEIRKELHIDESAK